MTLPFPRNLYNSPTTPAVAFQAHGDFCQEACTRPEAGGYCQEAGEWRNHSLVVSPLQAFSPTFLSAYTCHQMFRDPRFDDLSGEYKPEIFEKTYKFIDDIKSREKQVRNTESEKGRNKKSEEAILISV